MIKEKIELAVTVEIEYPTKADRKQAIVKAEECVMSTKILGSYISCKPLKARILLPVTLLIDKWFRSQKNKKDLTVEVEEWFRSQKLKKT